MQYCLYRSVGGIFDYLILNAFQFASVTQPHLVNYVVVCFEMHIAVMCQVLYRRVRRQSSFPKDFAPMNWFHAPWSISFCYFIYHVLCQLQRVNLTIKQGKFLCLLGECFRMFAYLKWSVASTASIYIVSFIAMSLQMSWIYLEVFKDSIYLYIFSCDCLKQWCKKGILCWGRDGWWNIFSDWSNCALHEWPGH